MSRESRWDLSSSVPRELRTLRDARGRYWCPWLPPEDQTKSAADLLRWTRQRFRDGVPPDPAPSELPVVEGGLETLEGDEGIVWVGHASFLLRVGGFNVLTDPVWSERVSPVQWAGPRRYQPPGIPMESLPRLDAILLSHDHYDHLDRTTVRALARGPWQEATWFAPSGHGDWLRRQGVRHVVERGWWEGAALIGPGGRRLRVTAVPAQHWTRRDPWSTNARLWCGWTLETSGGSVTRRVYFAGDSGYFDGASEIGRVLGPFDASLLPIGAYEPRWFMKFAHMNPEEAVRTYRDVGGRGLMVPMHWGTFRLTDEDPLEPPVRAREAWKTEDLPEPALKVLRHGEGVALP